MSEHAEVEQEHRREAKRFCDAVDFLEEDELAQFLADHDAEVERKARLDEAKWWARNGQFDHRWSCSLDATNTPNGDYCDCDLAHRRKVASQRIAALERGDA